MTQPMRKTILIMFMVIGLCLPGLTVKADAAVISKMTVKMSVTTAGLVSVDTVVEVDFSIDSHGIDVFIPLDYKMTWKIDGKTFNRNYRFPITNLKVYDDPYKKSVFTDRINIRIGDPDVVFTGPKTYHYSYDLQLKDLKLDGIQLFYMNIVGTGWEMPIKEVEYQITLPKGWPKDVFLYQGPYGSTMTISSYQITNQLLSGSAEDLLPYEGVTIYTKLSNDGSYFEFVSPKDQSWMMILLSAVVLFIMVLIHKKYGNDGPLIITPQFGPIEGFSSSQIGYVIDGSVTPKDVVSVFIEWAYKGYLRIIDSADELEVALEKIKDIPESENEADKALFNEIFISHYKVTIRSLQEHVHMRLHQAGSMIIDQFEQSPTEKIFEIKSLWIKFLLGLFAFTPYVIALAYQLILNGTVDGNTSSGLLGIISLAGILLFLWIRLIERWYSYQSSKWLLLCLLGFFTILFYALGISLALNQVLGNEQPILIQMIIVQIITSVSVGFSLLMDRRTRLGQDTLGKILGLRNFIQLAEKDRINALVKDDPSYFYKLLPYAYLFGITEEWTKKFDPLTLQKPDWYLSSTDFSLNLFNTRLLSSLSHIKFDKPMLDATEQAGGAILRFGGEVILGGLSGGRSGGGHSGGGFGGGGGSRW